MKIVPIFDKECFLLSAQFNEEDTDEFTKFTEEWIDIEILYNFFTLNETDLKRQYWNDITIEEAIIKTREDANQIIDLFIELSAKNPYERIEIFRTLFKPLKKTGSSEDYLERKKAYGLTERSWLRIYALKVGDDMYCITGSTIKLTDNMEEREHTNKELQKIESCRQFLKEFGVIDEDGMISILEFGV